MQVFSRGDWDAEPATAPLGRITGAVAEIFIHHTVTDSGPRERERELMREVQQIAFSRGFHDISYSFLVFPTGNVYEGRGFGTEGAHTLGHNSTSYGMCLVGNYENEKMTDAQVEAVRQMIADGQRLGFITGAPTIQGHGQITATACPGRNAVARLGDLRLTGGGPTVIGGGLAPVFPGNLSQGASGQDVCVVQTRLRALGRSIDQVPGCPFGPQTEAAVKAFQAEHGLADDGVVGALTWGALFA